MCLSDSQWKCLAGMKVVRVVCKIFCLNLGAACGVLLSKSLFVFLPVAISVWNVSSVQKGSRWNVLSGCVYHCRYEGCVCSSVGREWLYQAPIMMSHQHVCPEQCCQIDKR